MDDTVEFEENRVTKQTTSELSLTVNLRYNSNESGANKSAKNETFRFLTIVYYLNKLFYLFGIKDHSNQRNLELQILTNYKKSELDLSNVNASVKKRFAYVNIVFDNKNLQRHKRVIFF